MPARLPTGGTIPVPGRDSNVAGFRLRIALLRAHPLHGWPTVHAPFGSPAKFGDPVVGLLSIRSGEVGALEGSLTDSSLLSGRELWQWYTNELGNDPMLVESETTRAPHASTGWRHLYTGRPREPQTRSYYYRHRWYDPHQARFLSRDPIGYDDGLLQYAYVGGNPISYVDMTGLGCVRVNRGFTDIWNEHDPTGFHLGVHNWLFPNMPPGEPYLGWDVTHNDPGEPRKPDPPQGYGSTRPSFEFWVPDDVILDCIRSRRERLTEGGGFKYQLGVNNCNRDTYEYLKCVLMGAIRAMKQATPPDAKKIEQYEKALEDLLKEQNFFVSTGCGPEGDLTKTVGEGVNKRDPLGDTISRLEERGWNSEAGTLKYIRDLGEEANDHDELKPLLENAGGRMYGATGIIEWGQEHFPTPPILPYPPRRPTFPHGGPKR